MNAVIDKNDKKVFSPLGASNHSERARVELDYYATDPKAVELLLEKEKFRPYIWECACGGGHLSQCLKNRGYDVRSTDIIYRGYDDMEIRDFMTISKDELKLDYQRDIITNPPYTNTLEFIEHALDISPDGTKIAMFLKVQFLEGKARRKLYEQYPPKTIYISSSRMVCAPNGDFSSIKSSAIAYAWYIWEKGYTGETTLKWFN